MTNLRNLLSNKPTIRRSATAAAVVVCLLVLGAIGIYNRIPADTTEVAPESAEMVPAGIVMEESAPVQMTIPSLGITTEFESPLGLLPSGEIEVPKSYEKVAYYGYGPTPGELGPAVILGHVDSYQGPAVFFGLGQLEEGDEIKIEREDGTTAVFAVTRLERHMQSGFPTREVYQDIDHAGLRLITCSGIYSHETMRYSHNLIVFAELVSTE